MISSSIMSLANIKAEWLTARQQVLAQNIANVNTPGYKSRDLVSFNDVLQNVSSTGRADSNDFNPAVMSKVNNTRSTETNASGNDVSLDSELVKLGETTSQYSLNTNIIKSFHRMLVASLKG